MKQFFSKRWKLLLVALIVLMILLGIYIKKHNLQQKEAVVFTSPDNSFSVEHPRSWETQIVNKGAMVATFISNDRKDLSSTKPYINIAK